MPFPFAFKQRRDTTDLAVVDPLDERPDIDRVPNSGFVERVGFYEFLNLFNAIGFIEKEAANHRLAVSFRQRPGDECLYRCCL